MDSPTLLVLAAGLGSRYGGIKQMDPVGPSGEFVLDYSMYDAWRAGFRKVVLVIRPELEDPLREHFADKVGDRLEIVYVYQQLADLPSGYDLPPNREKPWGTGHAIWTGRDAVDGPFGVINADDFYGAGAYGTLAGFLSSDACDADTYCMVAYRLANTLSDYGSVSRGICRTDENGFLLDVVERTDIEKTATGARFLDADEWQNLTGEEPASLNLWGFTASIFSRLESLFREFLDERMAEAKAEFFIPTVVDSLIQRGVVRTQVLNTDEHWFGMTYSEDRERVVENISRLIDAGVYSPDLWA